MARVEILTTVDKIVSSNLQPVSGASVQVNIRATGTPATVYAAETGGTTVSNPLVTDANGRVNGWLDEGSYVLNISGSGITSYNQPYEAVRGSEVIAFQGSRVVANTLPGSAILSDSIPNTKLAAGAVLGKHLSEGALPLGTIIAYWVPAKPGGGYAIPTGWLVCDGTATSAHDFPGGGSITLPNLIDKVLRGTNPSAAYGGSTGVNSLVGANTIDLSHVHAIPHTHNIAAHSHQIANHTHTIDHAHNVLVPNHAHGIATSNFTYQQGANNKGSYTPTATNGSGDFWASCSGPTTGSSGGATPSTANQTGGTVTEAVNTPNSASAGSAATDIRNASVGVLYLIKVRNTV